MVKILQTVANEEWKNAALFIHFCLLRNKLVFRSNPTDSSASTDGRSVVFQMGPGTRMPAIFRARVPSIRVVLCN